MATTQWDPRTERTVVDVRPGGPGNPWKILQLDGELQAPSGGGRSVESRWGRGANGQLAYLGGRFTGNPERFTATVMTRLLAEQFLSELTDLSCFFDVRVRERCDSVTVLTNYSEFIALLDAAVTSRTYSGNLANAATSTDDDTKNSYSVSAGVEQRGQKLRHDNISKSVNDIAFNKVRSVGVLRCADGCGPANTGDQEYIAVTDQDSTPGYSSNASPLFFWTEDGGNNWDSVYIDPVVTANALDVVLAGDNIVVAIPGVGCYYARFQDIKDGVQSPNLWSASTGFSGAGPNALALLGGSTILAVGNNGLIWRSTDNGLSFTLIDNAVTTSQNLTEVVGFDSTLAWIGGANATLLRYDSGTITPVIVQDKDNTLMSGSITALAVADQRSREVYVGTSGGEIWRTKGSLATRPVFEDMTFDKHGNGSIVDLQFAGIFGDVLFVVQTDVDGNSRVLRDLSGGALGSDVEIIGGFSSPGNDGINSIAPASINSAICVGEVVDSFAYIGKLVASS